MTKNLFKNLQSKWNVLAIALIAMMSVGLSSCGGGDDDGDIPQRVDPPVSTGITITNNSTMSFDRFTVIFLNDEKQRVDQKDYGTVSPGESVNAPIATGATQYLIMIYYYGEYYLSPYYKVSATSLSLTDDSYWSYQ